jgi:oligopeptide transport system substrate-binding protein
MLRNKRLFALLAIVMVVTMVLSGCAAGKAGGKTINLRLTAEPPAIDPNLATDDQSTQVVKLLFGGLTDTDDKTVEVTKDLASEWSVSSDGLKWTFKMRKDVQWVQYDPATKKVTKKGPVTANDVVYSVKRASNPATASEYAYVDYFIKNAQKINKGELKSLDDLGVKKIDDYTVEFTLEEPAGFFPNIAGLWTNNPVPQKAIEQYGDKWIQPGNIWTYGPYMLESWEHEKSMVMVKNPYYFNAASVDISTIHWDIITEDSTAFAKYENGELDVCAPPLSEMDRVKKDAKLSKELYQAPQLSTYYLGINTSKKPLDNVKVRQALSFAVDRQKLIDTVTKGNQKPAKTFAPPGIFGTPAEDSNFKGILFDPAKAKALLAEAGYPDGKGLPEITLMYNTSEGHAKIAQFVQQNWKEVLGIDVKLANQEWAVYLKTVNGTDTPQIYRMGWSADYPDENNWVMENFHPVKSLNNPKWAKDSDSAKRFMAAVEKAASAANAADRKKLYFEAEQILCEEQAIIIPIYYYTRNVCTKPYVTRTYAPLGGEKIHTWKLGTKS